MVSYPFQVFFAKTKCHHLEITEGWFQCVLRCEQKTSSNMKTSSVIFFPFSDEKTMSCFWSIICLIFEIFFLLGQQVTEIVIFVINSFGFYKVIALIRVLFTVLRPTIGFLKIY